MDLQRAFMDGIAEAAEATSAITPPASSYLNLFTTTSGTLAPPAIRAGDAVGSIMRGETKHLVSLNTWSAEHVVAHISSQTGPAHLLFCTWAMGEAPSVRITKARESGALLSVSALLDYRVKTMSRTSVCDILQAAMPDAKIAFGAVHAKVYLLWNDDWHVTIISSANMTQNQKIEAYVITEDHGAWAFHHRWITAEIENRGVFGGKIGE